MTTTEAWSFCRNNETAVRNSKNCGCFYCVKIFPATEIDSWAIESKGSEKSAVCPYCSVDSVIPDSEVDFDEKFLQSMYDQWFMVREFKEVS